MGIDLEKFHPLRKAVGAVVFLGAAFGGAVYHAAPPAHPLRIGEDFSAKVPFFVALFILLLIKVIATQLPSHHRLWVWVPVAILGFGVFLAAWQAGSSHRSAYSIPVETGEETPLYIAIGNEYTPAAAEAREGNPGITDAELLAGFGGLSGVTRVWTRDSLEWSRRRFEWLYVALVGGLAVALFGLAEGILVQREREETE